MPRQISLGPGYAVGLHHRWWWYVIVAAVALAGILWSTPTH